MSIVVLQLPNVKSKAENRPRQCPNCQGEILQRWGQVKKPVRDNHYRSVRVYRYRCCGCRRTFRHYPEGVDQADQTLRLRKLAALCWRLGLSYRGIVAVFAAFGVKISRMTAWRDAQDLAEEVHKRRHWQPVRVLGLDGAYVRGWGEKHPVLVAVDLGNEQPVGIGYVNERDPEAVAKWLAPWVQRLGVSVIVTDDLKSYRTVAEKLALEHQVCQFHVRRWVGTTLKQLQETVPEEWLWVVAETQQLIDVLPPEGNKRLYELWKQVPPERESRDDPLAPLDVLRLLLIRLSEQWHRYCVFYWQSEVPWTNNGTERVIGRMKIRAKSVRGYKTWSGMKSGLMLSGSGTC